MPGADARAEDAMGPYRTIVERELQRQRQRWQRLEAEVHLDAEDRQQQVEAEAAAQVLDRILREFDQAEADALDEMYADHLRQAAARLQRVRRGGA